MSGKKSHRGERGSLHVALGRGRTGKSTNVRYLCGNAEVSGRTVTVVDADRTNATLASFVPGAKRPDAADDRTCLNFLEKIIEQAIEQGGDTLIDMGGGDRLFLTLSEQFNLPELLKDHDIHLVLHHYAAGGRDDFETLGRCVATGLTSPRTIVLLNEGLAGDHPVGRDPFQALLNGRVVRGCIDQGARIVRIPAVPLATMVMADSLFITLQAAATGGVPLDEHGQPASGAIPLGVFRRLELRRWLTTLAQRYDEAGVTEWLP